MMCRNVLFLLVLLHTHHSGAHGLLIRWTSWPSSSSHLLRWSVCVRDSDSAAERRPYQRSMLTKWTLQTVYRGSSSVEYWVQFAIRCLDESNSACSLKTRSSPPDSTSLFGPEFGLGEYSGTELWGSKSSTLTGFHSWCFFFFFHAWTYCIRFSSRQHTDLLLPSSRARVKRVILQVHPNPQHKETLSQKVLTPSKHPHYTDKSLCPLTFTSICFLHLVPDLFLLSVIISTARQFRLIRIRTSGNDSYNLAWELS